jgi:hypothetical protein
MSELTRHTASASRPDLLDMAYINSLPQPFFVREFGDKDFLWPVNDFEVATGLYRIDVCGKLQVCHISHAAQFRDANGVIHDSADFYLDAERTHVTDEHHLASGDQA